ACIRPCWAGSRCWTSPAIRRSRSWTAGPTGSWWRTPRRSPTTAASTTSCTGARCPWGKRAPCCSARPASPAWGPREPRLLRGAAVRPPFPAVAALQQDRALGERLRQAAQQVNAGGTVLGGAQHQTAHPEIEHDDVGVGHVDVDLPRPAERFHHGLVEIDGGVVEVGPPSPRCPVVWRFRVVPVPTAQPDELLQTRRPVDESSVGSQFVGDVGPPLLELVNGNPQHTRGFAG